MNIDLSGKRAIVCGSSQGMGQAVAMQFAESGAEVILLARNEEALKKVRDELPCPTGQSHDYLVADFSEPDVVKQRIQKLTADKSPIHILVNNDGTPEAGPLLEVVESGLRVIHRKPATSVPACGAETASPTAR